MDLPSDIKHLYKEWMEDEYDLLLRQGNKTCYTYKRAMESLMQTPMQIQNPNDLKPLRFFGDTIIRRMAKRLEKYCTANGYTFPQLTAHQASHTGKKSDRRALSSGDLEDSQNKPKKKKSTKKQYVPQKDSAAYAMIKALHTYDPDQRGLSKETLISYSAEFTEISFVKNPNTYYSGWSSMKTLLDKELISTVGRPLHYFLTEEGCVLAETLNAIDNASGGGSNAESQTSTTLTSRPALRSIPLNGSKSTSSSATDSFNGNDLLRDSIFRNSSLLSSTAEHSYNSTKYSIWKPSDYDIILIVDNREVRSMEQRNFFSDKLTQYRVPNEVRPLAVGDGLWIARNRETGSEAVLDFIFERKRLDDFASSIVDGRFVDQKARLKSAKVKNIFYLIEEQASKDISRYAEAIQTGISLNITSAGFHIERTKDSDDTVSFMKRITKSITKYYSKRSLIVIEPRNIHRINDYSNVIEDFKRHFKREKPTHDCVYTFSTFQDALSKSGMTTVKEMFIKMLMTVKGVSLEKAIVIQDAYKTPIQLLKAYSDKTTSQQKQEMLFERFKEEFGTRKIGKALSIKIYETWGS